jgi:hypothetical protein
MLSLAHQLQRPERLGCGELRLRARLGEWLGIAGKIEGLDWHHVAFHRKCT